MQYLVIFTPKEQFATEGMPSDFMDKELTCPRKSLPVETGVLS